MFENMKRMHRLLSMGNKWIQVTSLDPGDRGQIVRVASRYLENDVGVTPEDAWLRALVGWIQGLPWRDNQRVLMHALQLFLDRYEHELPFSMELVSEARRMDEINHT